MGFAAHAGLLPGEDARELAAMQMQYDAAYGHLPPLERLLATCMFATDWKLRRMERAKESLCRGDFYERYIPWSERRGENITQPEAIRLQLNHADPVPLPRDGPGIVAAAVAGDGESRLQRLDEWKSKTERQLFAALRCLTQRQVATAKLEAMGVPMASSAPPDPVLLAFVNDTEQPRPLPAEEMEQIEKQTMKIIQQMLDERMAKEAEAFRKERAEQEAAEKEAKREAAQWWTEEEELSMRGGRPVGSNARGAAGSGSQVASENGGNEVKPSQAENSWNEVKPSKAESGGGGRERDDINGWNEVNPTKMDVGSRKADGGKAEVAEQANVVEKAGPVVEHASWSRVTGKNVRPPSRPDFEQPLGARVTDKNVRPPGAPPVTGRNDCST